MVRQIILIVILFATLAYAAFTYWPLIAPLVPFKPPAAKTGVAAPAATAPVISAISIEAMAKKLESLDEIDISTIEVKMIDPFSLRIAVKTRAEEPLPPPPGSGPEKPVVKPAEPQLEGVWIDSGMRIAFISGQSLSVGGTVLGWRVTSISRESVILQKGSLTKTLKVEGK